MRRSPISVADKEAFCSSPGTAAPPVILPVLSRLDHRQVDLELVVARAVEGAERQAGDVEALRAPRAGPIHVPLIEAVELRRLEVEDPDHAVLVHQRDDQVGEQLSGQRRASLDARGTGHEEC